MTGITLLTLADWLRDDSPHQERSKRCLRQHLARAGRLARWVRPAAETASQTTSDEPARANEPPAGERIAASLRVAFPDLPDGLAIEAEGERAILVDRVSKWAVDFADRDDAATHARWRKVVAGIRKNLAAGKPIAPGDPRVPVRKPEPAKQAAPAEIGTPRSREPTKEALLIGILRRPEGAPSSR